jgi:hypothetical protein
MMRSVGKVATIASGTPDDLFITCASFEERCLAVSERLSGFHTRCAAVVNFLSRTNAEGERRKRETAATLIAALTNVDDYTVPRLISVAPYDYIGLWASLQEELQRRRIEGKGLRVTVDISCFTKIQLIFLLKTLVEEEAAAYIRVLYAVPDRYNSKKGDKFSRLAVGYFDPLPLPLRIATTRPLSKLRRIAIVLLGHEGQRTLAAWRRIDPDFSVLVFASSADPALTSITEAENKFLFDIASRDRSGAVVIKCEHVDVTAVRDQLIKLLGEESRIGDVRVSIIPFGPKPLLLGTLLAALELDGIDWELMYPIPTAYNSQYSEGVREVYTFGVDAVGLARKLPARRSQWAEGEPLLV